MFKNMLKRSWLSIKRKLGRTVILSLIFFMMASLVLSAITVKSAVNAEMDYAKSTLGGTVSLQPDMETIRNNQRQEMESGADRKDIFKKMLRPTASVETANKIAGYSDYVKDYSYEISTGANVVNLETVETTTMGGPGGDFGGGFGGGPGGDFGGRRNGFEGTSYDISITGINAYAYIDSVKNGSMEIKDGTYFDETSENSVLVSYEFANLNDLKVGDKITLTNVNTEANVALSVIGIYDTSNDFANANAMYMNTETAAKFLSTDDYNNGNYNVSNVSYYMNNSEYADEFVEKINSDFPELAENNMKIAVDTSEYDAMSGSIENVGGFATTILIVVIVAAIIIVTLIVTINVKDRRYEMGVLLSLGATKKNIIGQIASELLIIGTIGFVLASITGSFTAKIMGDGIVSSQTAASAAQSERNFGRPGAQIGSMPPSMPSGGPGQNGAPEGDVPNGKMKDFADMKNNTKPVELDLNATITDYLLLFVTGYLVIVLALIIPSTTVLRYQPKEILAGKE